MICDILFLCIKLNNVFAFQLLSIILGLLKIIRQTFLNTISTSEKIQLAVKFEEQFFRLNNMKNNELLLKIQMKIELWYIVSSIICIISRNYPRNETIFYLMQIE